MVSEEKEMIAYELLPFLRVRNDGTVDRLYNPVLSPPSSAENNTAVTSKDITISPEVGARLYLPNLSPSHPIVPNKLPILVYFHGGGFCIESPFSTLCHQYMNTISSLSNAIVVSVDYRLAPEHPLPAAYDDSWNALQWVASHSVKHHNEEDEPWLSQHGDFDRVYIGGDSSGANISHHMALRAGTEKLNAGVKILGAFLSHPYFWGSEPIGLEPVHNRETSLLHKTWMVANYPGCVNGIDNPCINPFDKSAISLASLECKRLMICVASKDELRDRGVCYYEAVKESGWKGELSIFEVQGEGHGFHFLNPESQNARNMFKHLAEFVGGC